MNPSAPRCRAALAAAGLAASVLAACSAGAAPASRAGDWPLPNLDRTGTRADPASALSAGNVGGLRVLWRFRFRDSAVTLPVPAPETMRGVVATPLVAHGVVYVQDSLSSVYAIGLADGRLRWKHRFRAENLGRNGLAYGSGSLYGATDTTAFALSARTGRLLWQHRLATATEQYVDVAPLIADNLVFTGTAGYPPNGRGAIYALDAHSGAVVWRFDTIARAWPHPGVTGGGGIWYTPTLDAAGELLAGIANPYPLGGTARWPNGSAFGGTALYTDSLVALDARTGRLRWFDQVVPHDIRDYDFQLPPIAVTTADGTAVVLGAGKAGIVAAWDGVSHRRIWTATVGVHRNDVGPLPMHRVTVCPGFYGGVETPMATGDGRLFVPVVDLCARGSATGYQPIGSLDPARGRGEMVALDVSTGRALWTRRFPQPDFGCATLSAGAVFTATWDGAVYALDPASGRILWQAHTPAGVNGCPALSGTTLLVPAGSRTSANPHAPFELVAYGLRP